MIAWRPKRRATALAAALGVVTLYLAPTWLYPVRLLEGAVGSSVLFTIGWDVLWVVLCIAMLRQTGVLALRCDERPRLTVADVLLFAYIVVSVFLVGNLAGTSILYQTGDVAFVTYAERLSGAETVLQVVLTCCVAPMSEELLMRGVVFGVLRERWSFLASALVSAVLFVGLHGTLVHVPLTFLLGLFCAVLRERYGCVWHPIAAHAGVNALTTFVLPLVTVPAWMVDTGPVCALALGVLLLIGALAALVSRGAWYHG